MAKPFSIVFAGTSPFAVASLEALANDPAFEVTLVLTQPSKPAGRGKDLSDPPVKSIAEKLGLPVEQPEDVNAEWKVESGKWKVRPDFLIVVSYGQILSEEILGFPRIAPVNVHASLLPRWRGASPIQHAILAGDTETGVTIQRMIRALDAGPIIAQKSISLSQEETAPRLHDRLAEIGSKLLIETLKRPLTETPQNEQQATVCRKLSRTDGTIDPTLLSAEEIDRRVRALVPWPGVTCQVHGQELKILGTSLKPLSEALPLSCRDGSTVFLVTVQPPSKKPMSGIEWDRGRRR